MSYRYFQRLSLECENGDEYKKKHGHVHIQSQQHWQSCPIYILEKVYLMLHKASLHTGCKDRPHFSTLGSLSSEYLMISLSLFHPYHIPHSIVKHKSVRISLFYI